MRVLVTGDRNWTDEHCILRALWNLPSGSTVIHGGCRGADLLAAEAAEFCGLTVEAYPADWQTHGKAAGPIRNAKMLKEGKPDAVFAFHNDLVTSKGTADMVYRAKSAGIPVTVYHSV